MLTKKIKSRRPFKRHFQLVEIMIALFLVATCAIPVMSSFVRIYLEQRKMQDEIELDHLMRLAHAKLVEYLYREGAKGSSLKELMDAEKLSLPVFDGWQPLEEQSKYVFFYRLTKARPVNKKVENKILLNVEICAAKRDDPEWNSIRQHTCQAFVKRVVKEGQNEFD